jgi:hypothetical protein
MRWLAACGSVIVLGIGLVLFLRGCGRLKAGEFSLDHLVAIDSRDPLPAIDPDSGYPLYKMTVELKYTGADGIEWTAPVGTVTDGASVPPWALSMTGVPDGEGLFRAAVVHDAYCQKPSYPPAPPELPDPLELYCRECEATHLMFYEGCRACGASEFDATLWWAAVRLGGPKWDEPKGDPPKGDRIENSLAEVAKTGVSMIRDWLTAGTSNNTIASLDATMHEWERVAAELSQERSRLAELLATSQNEEARASFSRGSGETLLDKAMAEDPESVPLLVCLKGQHQRSCGELWLAHGEYSLAEECLAAAGVSYQTVLDQRGEDAGALDGIGELKLAEADVALARAERAEAEARLVEAEAAVERSQDALPDNEFAAEFAAEVLKFEVEAGSLAE